MRMENIGRFLFRIISKLLIRPPISRESCIWHVLFVLDDGHWSRRGIHHRFVVKWFCCVKSYNLRTSDRCAVTPHSIRYKMKPLIPATTRFMAREN